MTKIKYKTKVEIKIPYEKGTLEYENFMDSIGELLRDNPDYSAIAIPLNPKPKLKFNPSRR